MLCFSLPCGQPYANRWAKRLIEARRCLPPLKCPVAWRLLLIAEVKKCFITILLLLLPCQPPFLGPWRESVSSLLSNANSDFGLILGFFSCHGWNIYFPPAGCFKQAAICWDIHRACGEQAQQKLFRHFFLNSENVAVYSVHAHASAPLSLHSGWKWSLDISVWKQKLKLKCVSVWNIWKSLCGMWSPYSPHMTKLLCAYGTSWIASISRAIYIWFFPIL